MCVVLHIYVSHAQCALLLIMMMVTASALFPLGGDEARSARRHLPEAVRGLLSQAQGRGLRAGEAARRGGPREGGALQQREGRGSAAERDQGPAGDTLSRGSGIDDIYIYIYTYMCVYVCMLCTSAVIIAAAVVMAQQTMRCKWND